MMRVLPGDRSDRRSVRFSSRYSNLALPFALFTAAGKYITLVEASGAHSAHIAEAEVRSDGPIAILIRHGLRMFGTIHRIGGDGARFDFHDPLDGRRQAGFLYGRRPPCPVIVTWDGA